MHTVTSGPSDFGLPPRPGVRTWILNARDYGDAYTLRALIADADQAGETWLAFTHITPQNPNYLVANALVFARGEGCRFLDYDPQRGSIRFG